jgi:hypothetical protein
MENRLGGLKKVSWNHNIHRKRSTTVLENRLEGLKKISWNHEGKHKSTGKFVYISKTVTDNFIISMDLDSAYQLYSQEIFQENRWPALRSVGKRKNVNANLRTGKQYQLWIFRFVRFPKKQCFSASANNKFVNTFDGPKWDYKLSNSILTELLQ